MHDTRWRPVRARADQPVRAPADRSPEWVHQGYVDDVRPALERTRLTGRPCVLATLYGVRGGSPRTPGAQMLFGTGWSVGHLSGGCIEADLARLAAVVAATGAPIHATYGDGSPWFDLRLPCGGGIDILLERLVPDDPAVGLLLAAWRRRFASLWSSDGKQRRCVPLPRGGGTTRLRVETEPFTLELVADPGWNLIVVGEDPTALAIAELGVRSGFDTVLITPSGPETAPPIPGLRYSHAALTIALETVVVDRWTAVVAATHDPDADNAVIADALVRGAAFVGALGSRRRLTDRRARLRQVGFDEHAITTLRSPVGLPIGAKAPWEIAIATIAQIIAGRSSAPEYCAGHG